MESNQRGFRGGKHKASALVLCGFKPVNVVGKLRELSRGKSALVTKHMGNEHKLEAVRNMGFYEIIEQRPLKSCAHSAVYPEARARKLRASLVIDKSEVGAKINVILGLEIKLLGLSEVSQRLIVLLAARKKILVGKIGQSEHKRVELYLYLLQLLLVSLDLRGHLLHLHKDLGNVLSLFFILRNELICLVLLRLYRLGRGDKSASLRVKLEYFSYILFSIFSFFCQSGNHFIGFFLDVSYINHLNFLLSL